MTIRSQPTSSARCGTQPTSSLPRAVAVKLLDADTGDADAVSQFRAAACRAASLTHEGLVRVFDYCEPEPSGPEQRPYQVMEYVDGQPLAAQLQAGPLGGARTVDIVAQVSAALHAVHRAALAHGDIRPEKILLRRDGAAKLFGFSGTCPAESAAIGADLRALGVLARECLGEPTSPGEPAASVTDLVAELCAHPSAGHADVTAAIARRAAALRAQLGKAGGDAVLSASQSASSTQPLPRLPRRAGRIPAMRSIVVAVGTAAVIAIAFAVIAIFGASRPNVSASGADGAVKATTVRVTAAQLIGRPVGVVRLRLQQLGPSRADPVAGERQRQRGRRHRCPARRPGSCARRRRHYRVDRAIDHRNCARRRSRTDPAPAPAAVRVALSAANAAT